MHFKIGQTLYFFGHLSLLFWKSQERRVGDYNEEQVKDLIAEVKKASTSFSPEKQDVFIDYFDKKMKIIVLSDFDNEKDASIFLTLNRNLNLTNLVGIFKKEEYESAQLEKKLFSKKKYQMPNWIVKS